MWVGIDVLEEAVGVKQGNLGTTKLLCESWDLVFPDLVGGTDGGFDSLRGSGDVAAKEDVSFGEVVLIQTNY